MTDRTSPDSLRPGELVGPWRIEGYAGRGSYGVVFRARRAGHPSSRPVALKMAQCAEDPRFVREVGLLSRVHHPSLPQLMDRGWWRASTGAVYPYLVMEWIRGQTLYEWARRHNPTSRQLMKVVAQLAWGLEVVHRAEGLHRDVRGDNVLVEPEGRAVLTDFGSCTWRGAPPLTERGMPPSTREYQSPEAVRFEEENRHDKAVRYEARAEDDLYALAVSIYRLATGAYPPLGTARAPLPARVPPQALNERVVKALAALIERMLAPEPEARGYARDLAQAADSAAEHAGPDADVPLFDPDAVAVAAPVWAGPEARLDHSAGEAPEAVPAKVRAEPPSKSRAAQAAFTAAAAAFAAVTVWLSGYEPREETPEVARATARDAGMEPDAGTRGLGEDALSARVDSRELPVASASAVSMDIPKQPLTGQRRPPCLRREEAVIHKGCWKRLVDIEPPCGDGDYYEWQGACYLPVMARTRVPTTQKPQ